MTLPVRVISLEECKNVYGNIINEDNMCTHGISMKSGTCQVKNIYQFLGKNLNIFY